MSFKKTPKNGQELKDESKERDGTTKFTEELEKN